MAAIKDLTIGVTPNNIMERAAALAGWTLHHTGGGCMSYMYERGEIYYLCTQDDPDVPQWGEPVIFGAYYTASGEWVGEAEGKGKEWRADFSDDCDAEGTPGYTIERDGIAIHDPMSGNCQDYGAEIDPEAYYDMPRPVALFLSSLYALARAMNQSDVTYLPGEPLWPYKPALSREAAAGDAPSDDDVLIDDAINAMFATIQSRLGVETGDLAAMLWTGSPEEGGLVGFLRTYIHAERERLAS